MAWIRSLKSTLVLLGIGLVVLAGIAVIGNMAYRFYLDELYPPPPPADPPTLDLPVEAQSERVVIVVVDALREDIAAEPEVMPNLQRIAAQGRRGTSITQPVTMTLLSVLNIGTGKTPGLSWSVHNFDADVFPDESIFYWAHANGIPIAFHGDASWSQLFEPWADRAVTFTDDGFHAEFDGALTQKDRVSIEAAEVALVEPEAWPLVVLHLTSTDKVSHTTGALTRDATGALTDYAITTQVTDAELGRLFDTHFRPGDTWFITSDHGATDTGNHGGGEDVTRRAPFVLVGSGVADPGDPGPVEISLNSWAATLSVLLGVPVPRTAEVEAAYDLLALDDAQVAAVTAAHLERRREFVDGVATTLGADEQTEAPTSLAAAIEPAPSADERGVSLASTNDVIRNLREHRRWMYYAAVALGLLLQVVIVALVLHRFRHRSPEEVARRNQPRPRRRRRLTFLATALLWLLLMTAPLVFDHWLFRVVDILGHAVDGAWAFARAVLFLATLTMVGIVVVRRVRDWPGDRGRMLRRILAWSAFAGSVVATSQIVVKWPFGPLRETYFVLFVWFVAAIGWVCWRRGHTSLRNWAIAGASVVAMLALAHGFPDANLQLTDETSVTAISAALALVVACGALAIRMIRREAAAAGRLGLVGTVAAVLGAVLLYRWVTEPWAAKLALLTLALAFLGLLLPRHRLRSRRDGLILIAMALSHLMCTDAVALFTIAFSALVLSFAEIRLPAKRWIAPAVAASIGLLDIGFFYVLGYRFSLTEMDTRVVFMLDTTQIDLAQSFMLLALQHVAPWLVIWGCVVTNRLLADDRAGLRTIVLAIVGVFLIRTWGSFFGMEFYVLNHWYVSHAVPMFIMEMVALMLSLTTFAAVSLMCREGWSGLRRAALAARGRRDRSADLSAPSTATR